jgi:aminoglycoside phosphotransferase (APT) family kinase protein
LGAWLAARWAESFQASSQPFAIERFERLSKGQSSDLFQVSCRQGERAAQYVVRLQPRARQLFLKPDVLREARTLQALEAYPRVPSPKVWWIEPDARVLDAPFFVMQHVEGRVPLGRPSLHLAGMLPELEPTRRAALWSSAMDALVAIHAVDWRKSHAFLAPAEPATSYLGNYLQKMVEWHAWTVRGRKFLLTDAALDYLLRNRSSIDDSEPVLVWNDARVGNMIFGADDRVAAVIDWEGPVIGPAGIDLGYWMMMDEFHAEAIGVSRLEGWPGAAETLARYQQRSGREVRQIDYFIVLAAFFIATTLIRQADLGVAAGRLPAGTQMGYANTTTQMIARRLGLQPPPLSSDFIAHRQLGQLAIAAGAA